MTELNDHIKLLFARAAAVLPGLRRAGAARLAGEHLRTRSCTCAQHAKRRRAPRCLISFRVHVPKNFSEARSQSAARTTGLHADSQRARRRARSRAGPVRLRAAQPGAHRLGGWSSVSSAAPGGCSLHPGGRQAQDRWRFSTDFHCADCDLHYREPVPACSRSTRRSARATSCRGFRRAHGDRLRLVVPDEAKRSPRAP